MSEGQIVLIVIYGVLSAIACGFGVSDADYCAAETKIGHLLFPAYYFGYFGSKLIQTDISEVVKLFKRKR